MSDEPWLDLRKRYLGKGYNECKDPEMRADPAVPTHGGGLERGGWLAGLVGKSWVMSREYL